MNPNESTVFSLSLTLLRAEREAGRPIDNSTIRTMVERASGLYPQVTIDVEKVIRKLETNIAVDVFLGGELVNEEGHIDWLTPDRQTGIQWRFWERYRRWLIHTEGLPEPVVDGIDASTTKVLRYLEDPSRGGTWDRRGMVVGHVQSGKTSHYTGLVCKAADAGYRFIVILAGSENNLRAQTQLRLDKGFLGFSFGYGVGALQGIRVGVGLDVTDGNIAVYSLTNVERDFHKTVASGLGIAPGGEVPIVLVVKKNANILQNLITWTQALIGTQKPNDRLRIGHPAILVIDDECDTYSINTKRTRWEFEKTQEQQHPTRINGQIRELLHMFDRSSFVGYTATPFANIFIYHDPNSNQKWEHSHYGPDLFPESFIVSLDRNSEYVGPDRVFGLNDADLQGVTGRPGLPILRNSDDISPWIDPKHKSTWVPNGPLPSSLVDAIRSFVIVCAARRARSQVNVHNSMLIHLSRFVGVQAQLFHLVDAEVEKMRRSINQHSAADPRPIIEELKQLWERDFLPTSRAFNDPQIADLEWSVVAEHLVSAMMTVKVRAINGSSEDVLDYENHRAEGLSVIAIGGQKLQRGLTLEGLSVSYFQRSTKMYDTLMQMGRWFGYRPGYLDLCRLYLTKELEEWYLHIATATEELYNQFAIMSALGKTPREFGLKVATHPDGLLVTGSTKLRHAEVHRLSFGGDYADTRALLSEHASSNAKVVAEFIDRVGHNRFTWDHDRAAYHASDVGHAQVVTLLEQFNPDQTNILSSKLRQSIEYIKACASRGQLTDWTVAVASLVDENVEPHQLGALRVRPARRNDLRSDEMAWFIKTLVDKKHEGVGLSDEKIREIIDENPNRKLADVSGLVYRQKRDPKNGLLIIYPLRRPELWTGGPLVPALHLSFPVGNERTPQIEYVVTNNFWDSDDEEDE